MPRIRTLTGRAARSVIVDEALALFGARGIAGVSLADVAAGIGVTKAALYHHFKTKDELVLAALEPLRLDAEVLCRADVPPVDRPDALVDLALRHREVVLLGDPRVIDGLGEGPRRVAEAVDASLVGFLADGRSARDVVAARVVIAGIGTVIGARDCTDESVQELRRVLRAVRGLDPEPEPEPEPERPGLA